jgi:hypothetical protein
MAAPSGNPFRLCFRCGAALIGPVATDPRGREICASCAPMVTDMPHGTAPSAAEDDRVHIDLGPAELPPLVRAKPTPLAPAAAFPPPIETPVQVVDITPAPKRLPPAQPAPELEDMSKYAPANQYRPRVPSADGGESLPERKCAKCDYSLEGLDDTTCPECGHVNERQRRPKSQLLAEESRQIARMEYLKPAVTLGVGVVLGMIILAIAGEWGVMAARIGGLPVRVLVGTLAYFLCCLWFFGFDSPWRLTALRLAATYSISDIPFAVVHAIGFPAAMSMAYLLSLAISVFMFVWLFELDPQDAWLLVAVSAVVNVVVGFLLAVAVSMVF